jgi:hypothetical protein|tara:strand:- start:197 stop:502 length:306 start_codon:yes stop_codon:yes gene_type:complete
MEKLITETKSRTPEENILIAIIKQTMEDAFELSVSTNLTMADIQQARNWFRTKACATICDHIGTTQDHIVKLYDKLSEEYKTGRIDKDKLRFAIRRLDLKL